jgi:NAD(P)-dependent dehydrogenase (short-subunit alcohol dehydrogenase family)
MVRGAAKVESLALNLAAPASYNGTLQEISSRLGGIDVLVIAYGTLGEQERAKSDLDHAQNILVTNFTSAALWMLAAAKIVNPKGCILAISSVAGDRGRKSNFVYGAAKGGLALFGQGMAHDLATTGPHIIVAKPGFVITPMTAALRRRAYHCACH